MIERLGNEEDPVRVLLEFWVCEVETEWLLEMIEIEVFLTFVDLRIEDTKQISRNRA